MSRLRTREPEKDPQREADLGVHDATLALLKGRPTHDEAEDLHPSRLDPPEASLDAAFARDELDEKNARREARDA